MVRYSPQRGVIQMHDAPEPSEISNINELSAFIESCEVVSLDTEVNDLVISLRGPDRESCRLTVGMKSRGRHARQTVLTCRSLDEPAYES